MKRRTALAIARDLRTAERILEDPDREVSRANRRVAEILVANSLARLIAADDEGEGA